MVSKTGNIGMGLQGMIVFFLLIPAITIAQYSSHNGAPKYVPENGKKLLILGQDLGAVGGLDAYSDGYVNHMNHIPVGVSTYTGFPSLGGLAALDNWGSGDVHAQAYIEDSTFDHSAIAIGLYLVNQLGAIISGDANAVIEALGDWIIATERPVFLRIGYEFDGSWNNYNPTQFKQAWIYLVHRFDEMGIKNVAYVWQAHGGNTANIERWYPGDAYVNWVGYSHFDEPNPGQNILTFAEAHDKPVMIAEATPRVDLKTGIGAAHWSSWYAPLFERIYDQVRIKALAYINVDWDSQSMWAGQGWGDSRVQVNDTVKSSWQKEIQKETWILASDSLFDMLDYQLWQDSTVINVRVPAAETVGREQLLVYNDTHHMIVKAANQALMQGIRLFDLSGRLIYELDENAYSFEIPTTGFGKGNLVILQVRTPDCVLSHKTLLSN